MVKEMTVGSPFRLILTFAFPILLGSLLQQAYNLIDAVLVGRFVGIHALAGVGASSSVLFLILGFCNGCAGGFGIPIAQSFGARNYTQMRSYVANSCYLAGAISLFFSIVCSVFCGDILRGMNTPEEIFPDAYTYLLSIFLGIPCSLAYNLLSSIIRALGDSKTPFYFLLFSSVLNVILDLICILLLGWGAAGAGIATVIAQGFSAVCCFLYIRQNFPLLRMTKDEARYSWVSLRKLVFIGVPMGLQFSITAIGSIMLQSANNALGTACCTAFTTAMRIKMFFMSPLDNLGVAMATYAGQNLGAGKIERIKSGIKDSLGMCAVYWIFSFVFMWFAAKECSSWFIGEEKPEILRYSEMFLRISCGNYCFLGILSILRNTLQGLGFTRLALNSGISEMIARVCISIWVVPAWGFLGVSWGDPIAWMAACTFLIPASITVYHKLQKRRLKLQEAMA